MSTKGLTCLIIDDESDSISTLRLLLEHIEAEVEILAECSSVDSAALALEKHDPDFIFLDIEMPGKNGFELIEERAQHDLNVVIISGYEKHALQAIKMQVIDYLLKPIGVNELKLALKKVMEVLRSSEIKESNDKLIITTNNGFNTLVYADILSVEGISGNYSKFSMVNDRIVISTKPLSKTESEITDDRFAIINRGLMINMDYITSFNSKNNSVLLSNGESYPVAVRRKKEFRERYTNYLDLKRSKEK